MGRYIDTGDHEWLNADKVASIRIEQRQRHDGGHEWATMFDVVALLDGATWDADLERWSAALTVYADHPTYGDARWREDLAVDLARHLIAWLSRP
jgi:hypothetical protein